MVGISKYPLIVPEDVVFTRLQCVFFFINTSHFNFVLTLISHKIPFYLIFHKYTSKPTEGETKAMGGVSGKDKKNCCLS